MSIRIHKSLTFNPPVLSAYLKSCKKWNTKEFEIAAGLICIKAYQQEVSGSYALAFPAKNKKLRELNKGYMLSSAEFGDFLTKYIEENSDIDLYILRENPKNTNKPYVIPIQIKRVGLGKEEGIRSEGFIDYLNKLAKKYPQTSTRLIIIIEKIDTVKPQIVFEWINNNNFPFPEVILLHQRKDFDMEMFQLKPNNGITFTTKLFRQKEILS